MEIQVTIELKNSLNIGDIIYCIRFDTIECCKVIGVYFDIAFNGGSYKIGDRFGNRDFRYVVMTDSGKCTYVWDSTVNTAYFRTKDELMKYLEITTKWKLQ